jgi:exodeoxyribonuclease V beta subunit
VFLLGGFNRGLNDAIEVYHRAGRRQAHLGRPIGSIRRAVAAERRSEEERLLYVASTRARARLYLPYFGSGEGGEVASSPPDGPYAVLDSRLGSLAAGGGLEPRLFRSAEAPCPTGHEPGPEEPAAGNRWRVPWELLGPLPDPRDRVEAARRRARDPVWTSYSRMRGAGGEEQGEWSTPRGGPDELPGGPAIGTFLHQVLEELPFGWVRQHPDPASFGEAPAVRSLLDRLAARHGVEERFLPAVGELVHRALTAPLLAGPLELSGGIASLTRTGTEVDFLLPLTTVEGGGGYLQGYFDLLFTVDGRWYVLDWKSDRVPAENLAAVVDRRYALQLQVYAVALTQVLGVGSEDDHQARFGGILYGFLHAMGAASTSGVVFARPGWRTVTRWREEIAARAGVDLG